MFAIEKCTRPNRCEVCRWVVTEMRYLPPPPGSVRPFNPAFSSYGQATTEQTPVLVCKRMPPVPNEDGRGGSPIVWAGDFCGEFQIKEEAA